MLFLAVFCGFLAENFREHQVEHQREKQYIRSLIQDIKTDTANINEWSAWYDKITASCDTVLEKFDSLQNNFSGSARVNFFYVLDGFPDFIYTDRTMQQLKNAGNLRLIRKSNVSDSILAYDVASRSYIWLNQEEEKIIDTYRSVAEGIFDGRVLNAMRDADNNVYRMDSNPPLKQDADALFRLNYRIHMLTVYNRTLRRDTRNLLRRATSLLELLQKEYRLK